MSSAENSAPKPLSEKDIHVLAHAFSCMKSQPDVDYEALAEKAGMKDGKAAYKVLWAIKKKLATHGAPVANAPTQSLKGTTAKRGATAGTDGDGDETPAKKRKPAKPRAKKGSVKADSDGENMGQEENAEEDIAAV